MEIEEENENMNDAKLNRPSKYKTYTTDEKRELLILAAKPGQNMGQIGKLKGVGATNLRRWKEEFEKDPLNFGKDNRPKNAGRKVKHPDLDDHIKEWFLKLRGTKCPISPRMLCVEAQKYATLKGVENMKMSRGWQEKIMKRLKIVRRKATHIAQKSPLLFEPEIRKFLDLIAELR